MQNDPQNESSCRLIDCSFIRIQKKIKTVSQFPKTKKTFKIRDEKEDKNEAKIDSPQNHNWPRLK